MKTGEQSELEGMLASAEMRNGVLIISDELQEVLNATSPDDLPPNLSKSIIHSGTRVSHTDESRYLVSTRSISEGDVVVYGSGSKISHPLRYTRQIADQTHLIGNGVINHSCDPNLVVATGKEKPHDLIAKRPIKRGEVLTFNYLTTEWDLANPFSCAANEEHPYGEVISGFKYLSQNQRQALARDFPLAWHLYQRMSHPSG